MLSINYTINILFPVHPLVQVPNQLVGAPVLTDVTLVCNVEASPKAINYWQRENGKQKYGKNSNCNNNDNKSEMAKKTVKLKLSTTKNSK